MKRDLTDAERVAIARYLAVLDRGAVIGVREVAVLANTTPNCVYQATSEKRLARGDVTLKLPPRLRSIGRRVGWLHGDIRDMLGHCSSNGTNGTATPPTTSDATAKPKAAARMGRKRQA